MAIAKDSADQKRLSKEKGIKMSRPLPGTNKLPPGELTVPDNAKEYRGKKDKEKQEHEDAELIDKAKKNFAAAAKAEDSNRKDGLDDLKFLNGEQWNSGDASARAAEGRPCNTENRLLTFSNQITNDQRQNRPAIVISPMGDKTSKKAAGVLRGMVRAIERDSHADVAYDTAFQSAVHNGWGYARIVSEYESDTSFNKVLAIKPILNPMTVYLDPNRTPFGIDSGWGLVTEMMPKDEFRREYPEASEFPFGEAAIGDKLKDWVNDKEIRVAEYYYFEHKDRELVMLDNGHTGWEDELADEVLSKIESGRIKEVGRRSVVTKKLKWCKLTGLEILDRRDCDGDYVPILECDGTVLSIDGKTVKKGIVRDAKGAQQMLNYYTTLETENVALQPKAPWIMEEGQVEGHESSWKGANKKSFPYLLYKGVNIGGKPAPAPQRQPFAGPPAAILAAKQGAQEALKAITGIRFDATMSERMQDESGRAIRELNRNANLGAYHYIDNFGRFLRNVGDVLINLIPYVYDQRRVVSILDENGVDERVMINPYQADAYGESRGRTPDNAQGGLIKMFNPKVGRYQVTVTIGPSYATKRIEAAESQMDFIRAVPQIGPVIADLIAKNSDWDGAEEIAARIAKTQDPKLLTPDRADMSPQVQALLQNMQAQLQQQQQQMALMTKELSDRQKDRDVMLQQINSKHEEALIKVASEFTAKMAAVDAKREATIQGTIGRKVDEVAKAVKEFTKMGQQATKQAASRSITHPDHPGFTLEPAGDA